MPDAGAGNDTINAREGDDILIGGTGNDTLIGGASNDTYRFARGDGQDTVADQNWGNDTIEFGAGIAASDVTVVKASNGSDLTLKINDTSDQITLIGQVSSPSYSIEQVRFADGSTWTKEEMLSRAISESGGGSFASMAMSTDSTAIAGSGTSDGDGVRGRHAGRLHHSVDLDQDHRLVALMTQHMAAFGAHGGEAGINHWDRPVTASLDFFA